MCGSYVANTHGVSSVSSHGAMLADEKCLLRFVILQIASLSDGEQYSIPEQNMNV